MSDNNENEMPAEAEPAPERPATVALKKRGFKNRIIDGLRGALNYDAGGNFFDLAVFPQMQDMDDEAFKGTVSKIMMAAAAAMRGDPPLEFKACPHCGEQLEAPTPEVMVANLTTWQHARPGYFWWSPYELKQLLEYLQRNVGHVLISDAAHSIAIREPSGRVYTYMRDGSVK